MLIELRVYEGMIIHVTENAIVECEMNPYPPIDGKHSASMYEVGDEDKVDLLRIKGWLGSGDMVGVSIMDIYGEISKNKKMKLISDYDAHDGGRNIIQSIKVLKD